MVYFARRASAGDTDEKNDGHRQSSVGNTNPSTFRRRAMPGGGLAGQKAYGGVSTN